MAFEVGHKKKGGRKKGVPNKSKCEAQKLAAELGVDPLKILLLVANGDWEALKIDIKRLTDRDKMQMRINAAGEALQYIMPKKKAVEHSGPEGGPIQTTQTIVYEAQWGGSQEPTDGNATESDT